MAYVDITDNIRLRNIHTKAIAHTYRLKVCVSLPMAQKA